MLAVRRAFLHSLLAQIEGPQRLALVLLALSLALPLAPIDQRSTARF
jgi:hypothetical protein